MKKSIATIFTILLFCCLHGQTSSLQDSIVVVGGDPETSAYYPGGMTEFSKYIHKNIGTITLTEGELAVYRKPFAKFSINENGNVDSLGILRSSNVRRVDSLFIETLRRMPKWTPGTINGKPVRQKFNLPLTICFK